MNSRQDILRFLASNKKYLEEHYSISKIGLFGSYARNEATPQSDIDIIIELKEGTKSVYSLKNALREYLSRHLKKPVDLAREKYLKPYAREAILRDTLYV
jgi:predicted nucleotidyltransferase